MTLVLASCSGEEGEADTQASTSPGGTTTVPLPEVEEPPPTPKQLLGTWSQTGAALLFQFSEDGTFAFDRQNVDTPFAHGTYEVDGSKISFSSTGNCADAWAWEVGSAEAEDPLDDELHIVFLDSGCEIPPGAEWRFARVPD
jgi:hypothetical protein